MRTGHTAIGFVEDHKQLPRPLLKLLHYFTTHTIIFDDTIFSELRSGCFKLRLDHGETDGRGMKNERKKMRKNLAQANEADIDHNDIRCLYNNFLWLSWLCVITPHTADVRFLMKLYPWVCAQTRV